MDNRRRCYVYKNQKPLETFANWKAKFRGQNVLPTVKLSLCHTANAKQSFAQQQKMKKKKKKKGNNNNNKQTKRCLYQMRLFDFHRNLLFGFNCHLFYNKSCLFPQIKGLKSRIPRSFTLNRESELQNSSVRKTLIS